MTIPLTIPDKLGFPHTPPNSSPTPSSLSLPSSSSSPPSSSFLLDPVSRIHQLKTSFQNLPSQQQEWLLSEIVNQCDHGQLTYILGMVTPRLKVDFLKRLPIEIALHVVSFIQDPHTLGTMACVSKYWYHLLKDETTWKNMCELYQYEPYYHYYNNNNMLSRMMVETPSFSNDVSNNNNTLNHRQSISQQHTNDVDTITGFSYRELFIRKYNIISAWKHGGQIKVVDQGLEGLVTSLQCDDKYIVVGCENYRIEVFDTATGNKVRSLVGHEGGVWALEFKGDDVLEQGKEQQRVLVSAGCDRDVRVWNLETGELLHVLRGHISTVRCLKMKDKKVVVTGSRDYTLRVWDIEKGTAKHVLYGHQNSVRCLDISGNTCVSGSYDNTARVWDLTTGECRHVLIGHQSKIYSIVTDGIKVAAGSMSTHIMLWSVETGDCLATLQGHTSLVGQLELAPGTIDKLTGITTTTTLISGGADGCIREWDWDGSFECLERISAHDNSITGLQCNDRWILSCGSDGRVKLFDRKQSRLIRTLSHPAKTVWKIQFNESKAVLLMSRIFTPNIDNAAKTVLEIHNFDIAY
ncbi:WD40-repeat-containing domain protein [Chlamydoabsidia padenii]|nr:WD40-repeat-containing domain protein [Chlamydoabsidia padenii]